VSPPAGTHCPGCRGYDEGWEHECPGLQPGHLRQLVDEALEQYVARLEIGPKPGQPPLNLADHIVRALEKA
jgi:hypothetical protein